jgi:hypothetical protein
MDLPFIPHNTNPTLKEGDDMPKAKEGDLYICEECGMVVAVEDPCGCSTCELICCDAPMTKKAGTAKKATASKPKAAPKKAKAAAR